LPFTVPESAELPERLDSVLDVLYLLFNEGYSAHQGEALVRHDLCAEAIRLLSILVQQPAGDVPKAHALLALMLLQASRLPARLDKNGDILLLEEQDRRRWDRRLIHAGLDELGRSATGDTISSYHLQAGIAAVHAASPDYAATDWPAILEQYDDLMRIAPSPVVALNRAVALAMVAGPETALIELECIRATPGMDSYYLLHVTAAELHRRTGDTNSANEHYLRAQSLTTTAPEQRFLARKIAGVMRDTGALHYPASRISHHGEA
jgi:RNA polymerase sigma-70 factor (ECF subfamily)